VFVAFFQIPALPLYNAATMSVFESNGALASSLLLFEHLPDNDGNRGDQKSADPTDDCNDHLRIYKIPPKTQ